jgi:hypothetical protein
MILFTSDREGTKKLETITLYMTGGRKRLYLSGAKVAKSSIITIAAAPKELVSIKLNSNPQNGPKGIWTIDITPTKKGDTIVKADIPVKDKPTTKQNETATLKIKIVDALTLPPADNNEGLLTRLFMAESITPGNVQYSDKESKKSMEWMEVVLHNRLRNNPSQFMAPNAKSITDIVTAKGQVEGFRNYPTLSAPVEKRIKSYVTIANSNSDRRQQVFRKFIENAIAVAKPKVIKDPTPEGQMLAGWRTSGQGSPGKNFKPFSSPLSGNQFYSMKLEKKKDSK